MQLKIVKDVNMYVLTSTIKLDEYNTVKAAKKEVLFIRDKDGNDVFGMSYVKDKDGVSKNSVTFGSTNEAGNLILRGNIPEGTENPAAYVAGQVEAALPYINEIEGKVPEVAKTIKDAREALIKDIVIG